ncbi:hypothetical protein ACMA1D_30810 [Streptomyces sp. 796.1]|uniref:hypothetical protein n=1 Tax=Streptomyces sp. 796.1 TaxID=3163029 RepID=UPI0039C9224B
MPAPAPGAPPAPTAPLDDPATLVRRDIVLIFAVQIDTVPAAPYAAGPLVRWWRRGGNDVDSSTARRVNYTDPRLEPLLWGPEVRWHREVGEPGAAPHGFRLSAVELVRLNESVLGMFGRMGVRPAANGVVLLHGSLPAVPPAGLARALRNCTYVDPYHADGAYRDWVASQLPPGCRLSSTEREAVHCTLVTARDDLPRLNHRTEDESWSAVDQWLWQLNQAADYPPGSEAREELAELRFPLPSDVRAVLGQRGLVLVGSTPDSGPEDLANYYNSATHHLHTLYADALALGRLQQIVLGAFGREVARLGEAEPRQRVVAQLERDLLVFRRGYLAADFGRQATVGGVLRRWKESARLPDEVQTLKEDLSELSRQVLSAETETSNAILGLFAAVGLPLSVGLGIWQGLPGSGATALGWTLAVTGVVTVLLLVVFPGLRRLAVDLFRRGRSR